MKIIYINGEKFESAHDVLITIEHAIKLFSKGKTLSTFALALNGNFVGKAEYANKQVEHGDSIDLLFPIQGG